MSNTGGVMRKIVTEVPDSNCGGCEIKHWDSFEKRFECPFGIDRSCGTTPTQACRDAEIQEVGE